MMYFLEFIIDLLFKKIMIQGFLSLISIIVAKNYLLYLDVFITRGLLASAAHQEQHALCPWSPALETCVHESSQLSLVNHQQKLVASLIMLPSMTWTTSGFNPQNALMLHMRPNGATNGRLSLNGLWGHYTLTLSVVGALRLHYRPHISLFF
jgi:hypothetical protein